MASISWHCLPVTEPRQLNHQTKTMRKAEHSVLTGFNIIVVCKWFWREVASASLVRGYFGAKLPKPAEPCDEAFAVVP
jgi:hypothetical protein